MAKGFTQFAPLLAICLIFPVLSVRSAKEPGAVEAFRRITLYEDEKVETGTIHAPISLSDYRKKLSLSLR